MKGDERRRDVLAPQQYGRGPGVLAGDEVGVPQDPERTQGDVLQVADRGRNECQRHAIPP